MTAAGTTCSGRHCAGTGEPEARGLEPRSLLGVVVARAAPRCKSELGFPSVRVWLRAGRAHSRRGVVRLRGLQRGLGWPRVSRALSPGVGPDPPLAGPLCLRARVPAGSHLPAEPRRFSVGALPGKVASSRGRSGPYPFPWALVGQRWLPRNPPPRPRDFPPVGARLHRACPPRARGSALQRGGLRDAQDLVHGARPSPPASGLTQGTESLATPRSSAGPVPTFQKHHCVQMTPCQGVALLMGQGLPTWTRGCTPTALSLFPLSTCRTHLRSWGLSKLVHLVSLKQAWHKIHTQ